VSWCSKTELGKTIAEVGEAIEGLILSEGVLRMRNKRQKTLEADATQQSDGKQT
jgi:hypothetical protein